jgi:uncharacterized OB-fold protein
MPANGKIYSFTVVYSASEDFKDKTPYLIALVEEGSEKVLAMLDGYQEGMPVQIGDPVECAMIDGQKHYKMA